VVLAIGQNAQAVTVDAGVFTVGNGDAANPIVINVPDPGPSGGSGFFLDTINFDLGAFTHFNMTSSVDGLTSYFGASIFENDGDSEVVAASATHVEVLLADLGLSRDYHLHPSGVNPAGVGYSLTMWGSNAAPVPVPAAVYLFGSGLIGLVGLARRKMSA
jgi:hypothetical protein